MIKLTILISILDSSHFTTTNEYDRVYVYLFSVLNFVIDQYSFL